jgi:hypothetical protein
MGLLKAAAAVSMAFAIGSGSFGALFEGAENFKLSFRNDYF